MHGHTVFHNYDYSLMSEDTDFHKDGWIQVSARKTKPVLDVDNRQA